ncbi:MAG: sigma 54-interacting transcriptional regulator [Deltaproteobacteria bacterium]|nr:sigma 54-interacting transcriptional regulator [Deltaproteobacteria bacterium]
MDVVRSLPHLLERLAAFAPADRLVLRSFDRTTCVFDTVAVAERTLLADALPSRSVCLPEAAALLHDWFRRGEPATWDATASDPLRSSVVPTGLSGPVVVAPLADPDGRPVGAVCLQPALVESGRLLRRLLEPLSVALVNSGRLEASNRLREAAEADKRAALARLQRQDISDSIVGAQTGLRDVMERVEQVAPTDATVLILGETGSGKEVVARAIHARSRQARGPFLRVNCGAIPSELVDSELFGHERGSFTGAIATRKGWFERADGGTLFLDEVGELPLAAQVRLLRVLQDGSFERVGGEQVRTVNVRLVAATHRDMYEQIEGGYFREDLWYRIGVFPIVLPPLRARVGDIPALAAHFAANAGIRLHGFPLVPSAEDLCMLQDYAWPGNVRELASVVERATILGGGRRLAVKEALGVFAPRRTSEERSPASGPLDLDAAVRRQIEEALRRARGCIEGPRGAAALLGVNPHTLRSRMRKLGIDWTAFR